MAVDLGEPFSISKVSTLGKADDKNRYIKKYALEYSSDGTKWDEYKDKTGKRVSFYAMFLHDNLWNETILQSHDIQTTR